MRKTLLAVLFLVLCPLLEAQQSLNNDAIVKLTKAGLSDDLIVNTINASVGTYDTSTNGLIALKKAKVSDKVVSALLLKASGATPAGPAPAPPSGAAPPGFNPGSIAGTPAPAALPVSPIPPGVDSVGVYYQDPATSAWQEVTAEVVNFKTSGALKHIASVGIVKGDMNGDIGGNRSRLALKFPASFILYVPEGTSPGEYQLLRLHVNPDSREFRSVTGGVVHESGGAAQAAVDFSSKKLAPRVYQITLNTDIGKGEYGFLPPMDAGSGKGMASSGKIYTFSLVQQ
jgi:hypothetical protein